MRRRSASFRGGEGVTLHTLAWYPEGESRALLVLAHGYAEHAGRYDALARELAGRGFEVHALDFAGHGRSAGRRGEIRSFAGQVADLRSFVSALRAESPGLRCGLFGHSVGGATAAAACADAPDLVDALAITSPYLRHGVPLSRGKLRLVALLGRMLPRLPVGRVDAEALSRIPDEVIAYRADPLVHQGKTSAHTGRELLRGFDTMQRADRIVVPLLILHGTGDRVAEPTASRELAERVSSADVTLELVDGGFHELLNDLEGERIRQRIGEWFAARLLT